IYPDPPYDTDQFTDIIGRLYEQINTTGTLRAQLRESVALERAKAVVLARALTQMGLYVQNMRGGDQALIALAAMDVSRTPSPVGALPKPSRVAVVNGP